MALAGLKGKPNGFPAPNRYDIPEIIGHRHPWVTTASTYPMRMKLLIGGPMEYFSRSPGPGTYAVVPLEAIKLRAPACTLRNRILPLRALNVPSPDTYHHTFDNKHRSPAYTLRLKNSPWEAPVTVLEPELCIDWE